MKKLLYLIVLLLFVPLLGASCSADNSDDSPDLVRLDSLLNHTADIDRQKQIRISDLRHRIGRTSSVNEQYLAAALLFDEYSVYDSDSAMKYADQRLELARRSGNTDWEIQSIIDKSELLTGTGMLHEAAELMARIDSRKLSTDMLVEYYGQMIFLLSHQGNYAGGNTNDYYIREREYKDSIMAVIYPEHPEYYWYRCWDVIGTDKKDPGLIAEIERHIADAGFNTRQNAKDAYALARLCRNEGDMKRCIKYLTMSAIADVNISNADIASLDELAQLLFDNGEGDIYRAYRYVNYCLNKAISFPNRVRAIGINKLLDDVNKAFNERIMQEKRRSDYALVAVCILAAVLISAIIIIIVQNRRLRRQSHTLDKANKKLNANVVELSLAQAQLNEANAQLKELNADLQQKNEDLNEANYVKEEYIGYIFTICSNYIRKLEEFRSSIHVKAVSKKYKEILEETDCTDMMRDELKDFYRSFDSIFLHIYPDFINDFNSLLHPDKRITPKEGELLNTDLRIYALVRLGITDSIKIAEFLHCSPQTVYNNRFKVRTRALVPKKDFAEAVRTLGKAVDMP